MENVVLLTGRGGSGTRLLTEPALQSGIFLGNQLNVSGDSIEWAELIYDIVERLSGYDKLPHGNAFRNAIRSKAQEIRRKGLQKDGTPWGIKLPELMLVLPLFLDALPKARVVHLIRNPVSLSLRRTHLTSRMDNRVGRVTLPAAYHYAGLPLEQMERDPEYLHNAYAWLFQVERVIEFCRHVLEPDQCLELKYEELCESPLEGFQTLQQFLAADHRTGTIPPIDKRRADSWRKEPNQVKEVWNICGELAQKLGYTL